MKSCRTPAPAPPSAKVWITILIAALATSANAAMDSFRLRHLYSNQDGAYQFIELEEIGGKDDQHELAGLTLTVRNRNGGVKVYTFPSNLPNSATAHRHVLIMSQSHADAGANHDFVMPDRFLPTDGGTVSIASLDSWTFGPIPHGGELYRDDHPTPSGIAQTFDGRYTGCCWGTRVNVQEYRNTSLDRFFIASMAPDIDLLESGGLAGWIRTSESFRSWPDTYGPGDSPLKPSPLPVCRYFIPPDSHFFSVLPEECASLANDYPAFVLETGEAFYAYLPDKTTGECPLVTNEGTIQTKSVYRIWNKGAGGGHRFVVTSEARMEMLQRGWLSEGYGPFGTSMCVSP